jgi:hypothetical protein
MLYYMLGKIHDAWPFHTLANQCRLCSELPIVACQRSGCAGPGVESRRALVGALVASVHGGPSQ